MLRYVTNGLNYAVLKLRPLFRRGRGNTGKQTICNILILVVGSILIFTLLHLVLFFLRNNNDFGDKDYFGYFKKDLSTCWVDPLVHHQTAKSSYHLPGFATDVALESWETQLSYVYCNKGTGKFHYSNSSVRKYFSADKSKGAALFTSQGSVRPNTRFVSLLTAEATKPFETHTGQGVGSGDNVGCPDTLQMSEGPPVKLWDAGTCGEYTTVLSENNIKCLPSFIIIGSMKAGTGELMKWLETHPQLKAAHAPSGALELHFFSQTVPALLAESGHKFSNTGNYSAEVSKQLLMAYLKIMPFMSEGEARSTYMFEKSPDYIRNSAALRTMRSLLPALRLVLLIRDPAKRTASEFAHNCRHQRYAEVEWDSVTVDGGRGGNSDSRTRSRRLAGGSNSTTPVTFMKGDIVRIRGTTSHRNSKGGVSAADSLPHDEATELHLNPVYDVEQFPAGSLRVLSNPCTKGQLHRYFFGSASRQHEEGRMLQSDVNGTQASPSNSSAAASSSVLPPSELARLRRFPEVANSVYSDQVNHLLQIFPASRLLVLLQEDMLANTVRTLRSVEQFAKLPCFDFRKVAMPPLEWQGPSRSEYAASAATGGGSHGRGKKKSHPPPAPPLRAPFTVYEKLLYVGDVIMLYYDYFFSSPDAVQPMQLQRQESSGAGGSGGSSRLRPVIDNFDEEDVPLTSGKPMAATQWRLRAFFAEHNAALQRILVQQFADPQPDRLAKAGWSMPPQQKGADAARDTNVP